MANQNERRDHFEVEERIPEERTGDTGTETSGRPEEERFGAPCGNGPGSGTDSKRKRRRSGWLTAGIVLSVFLAFMMALGAYLYIVLPSRLPWGDDGMFTMMIVGTDVDYVGPATRSTASIGRADTTMLLMMPRNSRTVVLMSIPRDTLVSTNGRSSRVRFNSLYKGIPPAELAEGVKKLTGLEVDRWLEVNFEAFVGLVDAIGGVEVDVEKRMRYTDTAGGYKLDLKPGRQLLDGKTALAYVRFRNDALGDIARVSRQQDFVMSIIRKTVSFSSVTKLDEFKAIVDKYVVNDMNLYEYAAIGMRALKIGPGNFSTTTLPGNFSGPYWEADSQKIAEMIDGMKDGRAK